MLMAEAFGQIVERHDVAKSQIRESLFNRDVREAAGVGVDALVGTGRNHEFARIVEC